MESKAIFSQKWVLEVDALVIIMSGSQLELKILSLRYFYFEFLGKDYFLSSDLELGILKI